MNEVDKIKEKYNPSKTWYHGTGHDISHFSYDYLDKGRDALGVGFYFSDNPDTASAYAKDAHLENKNKGIDGGDTPNVIPVHIKLKKATSHERPLTRLQISKVLKDAPDFNDKLSNFGDVDYEGYQKVLNRAVSAYSDMPAIDAKHTIYSDFYNGHPEHFLKTFTKHTGYDHSRHIQPTGEHHVVVFHPNMIKSVNAKFEKESSNLLESLKEFLAPYEK